MKKNRLPRYLINNALDVFKFKVMRFKKAGKPIRKPSLPVMYNGIHISPVEQGTALIEQLVKGDSPFTLARITGSELSCIQQYIRIRLGLDKQFNENNIYIMGTNAGFFPADTDHLCQYGALIEKLLPSIDVMTVFNQYMERYVISTYCDKPKLIYTKSLTPHYSPWTRSLKGMKVLAVHPYAELIASQYKKREFLFPGADILPEFNLQVFPAIQTSAGQKDDRFATWFEALDYMMDEIGKIDFDIALIGAGAYGMPLSVRIKEELNKKAVQLGGLVQILFGIRGKRWDQAKVLKKFYNEHWVRPGADFRPEGADKVEDGCYW